MALATLLLGTSCSNEEQTNDVGSGDAVVTLKAQLPAGLQTKTIGDGLTATTLSYAVYAAGSQTPLLTSEDEVTFTNGQAILALNLASGKSYDILLWADAYDKDDANNPYTVNFNTQELTVDYTNALSNEEARDAFYGKVTVEVKGAITENVTLTRPFAQMNIGTNDMKEAQATVLDVANLKTSVTVKGVYSNLNLMSGEVGNDAEVTFALNNIPQETFMAKGETYDYLALNYLLVDTDKTLIDCKFSYTDGKINGNKTFSNVPVQRNYRTNIFGALLTGAVDFDITIEPDFEGSHDYLLLQLAAQNGGKVTLTEDVTLDAPLTVAAEKNMIIDLNGKTLENKGYGVALQVAGNLTINGDGTVKGGSGGNNVTVAVVPGGTVTINGGNYTVGPDANNSANSCIYSTGGDIYINGGTFESEAAYNGKYYVLNLQNGSGGSIVCTGGTFKNFDPADGDDHDQPTNFVADGYSSVKISNELLPNGTYQVVKGIGVSDLDDLKAAIAELTTKGGDLVIPAIATIDMSSLNSALTINHPTTITVDGTITSNVEAVNLVNRSELTIKGSGSVNFARRVVENYGTLTVEGGTYSTTVNNGGTAFWNNSEDAVMTLNDVTVNASFFAVAGPGKININGGTIASTSSNKYGSWAYCIRAQQGGQMTIKDATIKGVQGCIASIDNSYVAVENVKVEARNSKSGKQDAFYALYAASEGVIEVISGDFYSDRTPCCYASDDDIETNPMGSFVLKGGRYSSMPKIDTGVDPLVNATPAAGYKFVTISESPYVLEIVPE